jgi:hypothetical protein
MADDEDCHFAELMVEQIKIESVERKQKMEVDSVNPMDFGRKHAEGESVVAVAVPEPTDEPNLQMKQVEVAELSETGPVATKYAARTVAVVVVVAAAAAVAGSDVAAVALPEPALRPIHLDLHLEERLKLLGG